MNRFRETREKERRASDAALENKYAFDRNMPHTLQYDTYCWFVVLVHAISRDQKKSGRN